VRKRALCIALSVVVLCLVPLAAAAASLTILHTNDTHGHLLPFSYPQVVQAGSELVRIGHRHNIGGIARRATMVKRIRDDVARQGGAVWLVDAGDFSDGTPFSTEYDGEADVAAMNAAGYTFATLGNHEFNHRLAQLRKLIGLAKYPILCANATDAASGKPLAERFVVNVVDGVRVGVFGLTTHEAATFPAAKEGVTVAGEVETARKMVALLQPKADIIVLISHAGKELDEEIAAQVPGIDVIVGGHSHARLPVGDFVWRSEELKTDQVNGTLIVQAHQWGGELGRLDLLIDKGRDGQWHVVRYRERLMPVTAEFKEDAGVAAVVEQFWRPIAARYGEVVGHAAADFSARGDDDAAYNLVADAVRETFNADVALENLGGVRAPLVAGAVTRGDLIAMDPFGNTVITCRISGRQLRALLIGYQPAVSGVRYRLQAGELVDVSVGGRPLEDDRVYTATTNSYFAGSALKGIETQNTGKRRLDVLLNYVRDRGTIKPAYDGRRVVIGP
jgi:5'-nucleotidase/UDP-sugar diphosphatase